MTLKVDYSHYFYLVSTMDPLFYNKRFITEGTYFSNLQCLHETVTVMGLPDESSLSTTPIQSSNYSYYVHFPIGK